MRRIGRIVHAVAGAVALVEMSTPGPQRPPPLFEDPRYGSCTELVVRLERGAWFDDHTYDAFGQVLLLHGTDEAYRLTAADADCILDSEQLVRLVRADVETHRQNQASECRSLLAQDVGWDEIRPEVQLYAEALLAYRDEVCAGPVPSLLLGE